MHKPFLIIISAPSGCGKTTVAKRICCSLDDVRLSVSHTTRQPRENEINGKDYHFVSKEFFEEKIKQNFFIEYANVIQNYYGSSKSSVESIFRDGMDVIFDIDWQGMRTIKKNKFETITIFLLPPSISELKNRLIIRGANNETDIAMRLDAAEKEIKKAKEYDYVLINKNLDKCIENIKTIILAERLKRVRQKDLEKEIEKISST